MNTPTPLPPELDPQEVDRIIAEYATPKPPGWLSKLSLPEKLMLATACVMVPACVSLSIFVRFSIIELETRVVENDPTMNFEDFGTDNKTLGVGMQMKKKKEVIAKDANRETKSP